MRFNILSLLSLNFNFDFRRHFWKIFFFSFLVFLIILIFLELDNDTLWIENLNLKKWWLLECKTNFILFLHYFIIFFSFLFFFSSCLFIVPVCVCFRKWFAKILIIQRMHWVITFSFQRTIYLFQSIHQLHNHDLLTTGQNEMRVIIVHELVNREWYQ